MIIVDLLMIIVDLLWIPNRLFLSHQTLADQTGDTIGLGEAPIVDSGDFLGPTSNKTRPARL